MAKTRDPRRGFVARWFHRLRRLNRLLFIAGLVGGVVKAVQRRSGGGSAGGSGNAGGGPGGSGRPAPVGGPTAPRRTASVATPMSDDDPDLNASAAPAATRTLVSVPPFVDDNADDASVAEDDGTDNVVVSLADVDLGDDSDAADGSAGVPSAPLLTIVSDTDTDSDTGSATGARAASSGSWVAPLESGECPDGYPVKANDNSGIYHVPGGRSYNRTVAERCYASAEAAEVDGYRPAKR